MFQKFRENHLFCFLNIFERAQLPLDLSLKNYFKNHKSIGAHDRRFITDMVYRLVRWKGLFEAYLGPESSWEQRYAAREIIESPPTHLPPWVRCGTSEWIFKELCSFLPESRAEELCFILNEQAPTTLRANLLKTTPQELLKRLPCKAVLCAKAKAGIHLQNRVALTSLKEFKEGLFEIQDEGSQLVSELVACRPGDQVLDYCSGSGGKSLAFAHLLQGTGQIYLHDIRPTILQEAKKRLRRAGIQNAQVLPSGHPRLPSLRKSMDWVLVDVPCSGSGTYRRNSDMKWKMGEQKMQELLAIQRAIVSEALEYLHPEGSLVYVTCSLFERENEQQLKYVPLNVKKVLRLDPMSGGHDGFFGAVLSRK